MTSRRVLKVAEAIREVVSMAILTDLRDPRIADVTVTHVEVSPDLRYAKVHVSVMGDDRKQLLSLRGLESAAGFLQKKVGNRIDLRYTPRIRFELDRGVKHSIEVARLLGELLPPAELPQAAADAPGDEQRLLEPDSDPMVGRGAAELPTVAMHTDSTGTDSPEADEMPAADPDDTWDDRARGGRLSPAEN